MKNLFLLIVLTLGLTNCAPLGKYKISCNGLKSVYQTNENPYEYKGLYFFTTTEQKRVTCMGNMTVEEN